MSFNISNVKQSILGCITKTKFSIMKNSPEILMGTGITLAAGSLVLAIAGAKRYERVTHNDLARIKKLKEDMKDPSKQEEGVDYKKELLKNYSKLTFNTIKVYAPSVITFVVGVGCILGSHNIIKGRNMALAAAYATLDNGFRAYRERVAERFGEEVEDEIHRGLKKKKVTYTDENGKEKTKTIMVNDPDMKASGWAVWFDESNKNWTRSGVMNLDQLQILERFANNKLRTEGYVFLHDVYQELGIDDVYLTDRQIQGSHVVGWLYDPSDKTRDNYISFGLFDRKTGTLTEQALNMQMYGETNILLDFNVDGDILTGKIGDDGKPSKTMIDCVRKKNL